MGKRRVSTCVPPDVDALRRQQEDYTLKRPSCPCPNCELGEQFRKHEKRRRTFRFVSADAVWVVFSFLMRWKCVRCGTSFTRYPPGVDPYKQYLRVDRVSLALRYVEAAEASYRKVVRTGGRPLTYMDAACDASASESAKELEPAPRQLSHVSVHRWIGELASMPMIRWRVAECAQRRFDRARLSSHFIPAWKYRSDHRRQELVCCHEVLCGLNSPDFGTARGPP